MKRSLKSISADLAAALVEHGVFQLFMRRLGPRDLIHASAIVDVDGSAIRLQCKAPDLPTALLNLLAEATRAGAAASGRPDAGAQLSTGSPARRAPGLKAQKRAARTRTVEAVRELLAEFGAFDRNAFAAKTDTNKPTAAARLRLQVVAGKLQRVGDLYVAPESIPDEAPPP